MIRYVYAVLVAFNLELKCENCVLQMYVNDTSMHMTMVKSEFFRMTFLIACPKVTARRPNLPECDLRPRRKLRRSLGGRDVTFRH
jgi:hypothetical protein